jgi:hypothetical protein
VAKKKNLGIVKMNKIDSNLKYLKKMGNEHPSFLKFLNKCNIKRILNIKWYIDIEKRWKL